MKRILSVVLVALMLATGTFAAFEKVNTYDNNFSDVKDTNWFAKDVQSAYELGFMNGKAEGLFDPNGNVTVAEGITMAARVHAIYNGNEITKEEAPAAPAEEELRFDFDNMDNHRLNHAFGDVEDGILVMQPDAPNAGGNFDLGVFIEGVEIDASVYKTMKVRIKRDELQNINERRNIFEVFFGSEENSVLGAEGNFLYYRLPETANLDEWNEYTIDISAAAGWKNNIIQVRFDPTNDNGKYYIDYIVFTKGAAKPAAPKKDPKWYDMYVDYAVANKIITKTTFGNYDKNISRADLVSLFAAALPEDYFTAINDIKGIPDVDKNAKFAKALLMLYKAGVVTGSDAEGTFNPTSDIKRSEVAAIINRVALPENRQKKDTITAVWEEDKVVVPEVPAAPAEEEEHVPSGYDAEFDSDADLKVWSPMEVESSEVSDGVLTITPKFREPPKMPAYDPRVVASEISIDADTYKTLKVRMKADYASDVTDFKGDIYFMTEEDANYSEEKSLHPNILNVSTKDADGWLLVTIDLSACKAWKGTVTAFRFDPCNGNGVYSFDYIRFAK